MALCRSHRSSPRHQVSTILQLVIWPHVRKKAKSLEGSSWQRENEVRRDSYDFNNEKGNSHSFSVNIICIVWIIEDEDNAYGE